MTDIDHEEKRKRMIEERQRLMEMQKKIKRSKVVENVEDYLQENVIQKNQEV